MCILYEKVESKFLEGESPFRCYHFIEFSLSHKMFQSLISKEHIDGSFLLFEYVGKGSICEPSAVERGICHEESRFRQEWENALFDTPIEDIVEILYDRNFCILHG